MGSISHRISKYEAYNFFLPLKIVGTGNYILPPGHTQLRCKKRSVKPVVLGDIRLERFLQQTISSIRKPIELSCLWFQEPRRNVRLVHHKMPYKGKVKKKT